MTIRLSADQNSATIPPTKAVSVRFVGKRTIGCSCPKCHFAVGYYCCPVSQKDFPCMPHTRLDGRNGYWAKAKKGGGK